MLKLFFISTILLLMLDSPFREVITLLKTPYLLGIMGWISYLGKGWIQAIPCLFLLIMGLMTKKDVRIAGGDRDTSHISREGNMGSVPIPMGLKAKKDARMERAGKKGLYAIVLAGILGQAIKHLIGRPRPKVMDALGITLGPSFASGFDSFPSGHAASAFALASTLSFFYPKMRFPLYIYGALVSISRVYIDAHFLSDVVAGIVLGLWIGWVVTTRSREDIKRMIKRHGVIAGIAALSFFLFFYRLGSPGLFDVDEAVFAESAREMVETGDWITPQYNYINRYDKPVLFYWLITSAYRLFGVNEFAARFWSATFGVCLVLLSYWFVRRIAGQRWGVLSALILTTSLEIVALSHSAITDMTLTLFITASLFCFFLGYTEQKMHKKWWYWGFYLSMALAVLTKGPVGIVLPALIIFLFILLRGQIIMILKEMRIPTGGLIFLSVVLPWYVATIWINGWEYIDAFFIKHNITRYTGVISGHSGPVYYFIPVILLTFFPWSVFLPYGMSKSFGGVFQGFKLRENLTHKESLAIFSALWFLVVFVFFSFSRTKLPGYIAPLSPALAILVGRIWDESISHPSPPSPLSPPNDPLHLAFGRNGYPGGEVKMKSIFPLPLWEGVRGRVRTMRVRTMRVRTMRVRTMRVNKGDFWMKLSAIFCLFTGLFVGAGMISLPRFIEGSKFASQFLQGPIEGETGFYIMGGVIIAGIVLSVLAIWFDYRTLFFGIMVGMITLTTYSLLTHVVPLADKYLQATLKDYARIAGAELKRTGGDLIVYGLNKPSIVFYARHPAIIIGSNQQDRLTEVIKSSNNRIYIISEGSKIEGLLNHQDLFLIDRKGGYVLLTNQMNDTGLNHQPLSMSQKGE